MKKVISVQVSDSILMKPDVVTIFSSIVYHDEDYKKCNEKGSAYVDNLLQIFKKYVKHEDISVGMKSVIKKVKYVENRADKSNITREAVKDGYDFYSSISVRIDGDSDNLESLIQILSDLGNGVYSITYNYSVSDIEQYRAELLSQMIEKAKARARVIATSSGVKLKGIVNVKYASEPQPYRGIGLCNSAPHQETYGVDYAKPQQLNDSIIVNFKI